MQVSSQTAEALIGLVQQKLSCFEVYDREDRQEQMQLLRCLAELSALSGRPVATAGNLPAGALLLAGMDAKRRRGRPPKL